MTKQANILDPTLNKLLSSYGVKLADSHAPHVGEEPPLHDGGHVDSELAVHDDDTSCPTPKGPLTHEDEQMLSKYVEGGLGVADWENKKHEGHVPSGEQSSFGTMLSGEGEKPQYTKKTVDPGYHHSQPDSELSTGGKEAEFLKSATVFNEAQDKFLNDIAYIVKTASAEEEMNPSGAVQGMLGQGDGAAPEPPQGADAPPVGADAAGGGDDGATLSPEELQQVDQILQAHQGTGGAEEEQLTPEEVALVQQILQEYAASGGAGDAGDAGIGGAEAGIGGEGGGEELSPEESAAAQQILQQSGGGGGEATPPPDDGATKGAQAQDALTDDEIRRATEIVKAAGVIDDFKVTPTKPSDTETTGELTPDELKLASHIVKTASEQGVTTPYEPPATPSSLQQAINDATDGLSGSAKIAKLQAKNAKQAERANSYGRTIQDLIGKKS
jgi:hypothetical protein